MYCHKKIFRQMWLASPPPRKNGLYTYGTFSVLIILTVLP